MVEIKGQLDYLPLCESRSSNSVLRLGWAISLAQKRVSSLSRSSPVRQNWLASEVQEPLVPTSHHWDCSTTTLCFPVRLGSLMLAARTYLCWLYQLSYFPLSGLFLNRNCFIVSFLMNWITKYLTNSFHPPCSWTCWVSCLYLTPFQASGMDSTTRDIG